MSGLRWHLLAFWRRELSPDAGHVSQSCLQVSLPFSLLVTVLYHAPAGSLEALAFTPTATLRRLPPWQQWLEERGMAGCPGSAGGAAGTGLAPGGEGQRSLGRVARDLEMGEGVCFWCPVGTALHRWPRRRVYRGRYDHAVGPGGFW